MKSLKYILASFVLLASLISPLVIQGVVYAASPDTFITSSPSDPSNDPTPTFEFISDQDPVTFECRLDGGFYSACVSPYTTAALVEGAHTFEVKAVNPSSEEDATPASFEWVVSLDGGSPISIDDCNTLQLIGHDEDYPLDGNYELNSNIDCNATASWNTNGTWFRGFDPIGDHIDPFTGVFDGQGFTIANLHIQRADDIYDQTSDDESYVGLFGAIESGGTVRNLNLASSMVKGYQYVGGIVGFMDNAHIEDSSFNVDVEDNDCNPGLCVWARFGIYGGGIVGQMFDSTLSNVSSGGPSKGSGVTIGGIAGMISDGSSVDGATSTSNVDGGTNVGGFVGELYDSEISNVTVSGNVLVESDDHKIGNQGGGFAGYTDNATISNSSASGNVEGNNALGGFIGYSDESTNVTNSHASGTVNGASQVGGFVGESYVFSVVNSYATGNVTSNGNNAGGFAGAAWCVASISTSYATGDVESNGINVGGFIGTDANECPGSTLEEVYATGYVSGGGEVGGLIGLGAGSTINQSYASGDVVSLTYDAGGLAGTLYGYDSEDDAHVTQSFATGDVTVAEGGFTAGGLVGLADGVVNMTDVYARGNVSAALQVGGLFGSGSEITTIINGYATGQVIGEEDTGGFNGLNTAGTQVISSFWDVDSSGQSTSYLGTGKSTAEMKDVATYTDLTTAGLENSWDFVDNPYDDEATDNIWQISTNSNDGYPCFVWSEESCADTTVQPEENETHADLFSAEDGSLISFDQTGCTVIGDASTVKESALQVLDPAYEYPVGFVDFNVSGCTVGGQATFTLTFTGTFDTAKVVIRKYNSVTHTYITLTTENSGLSLSQTTLSGKPALRVVYQITDGGILDQDGVNGQIYDPIGVGINTVSAPNTGLARH